jgi:hypothetical protein
VADFVKAYRGSERDAELQSEYLFRIGQYITASCWRKMQRRIQHWSSLGYIYILGRLEDKQILDQYKGCIGRIQINPHRTDTYLWSGLKALKDEEKTELVNHYTMRVDMQAAPSLDILLDVLECANTVPKSNSPTYNKETCVEFHKLLIAVLCGYGSSLVRYHEKTKQITSPTEESYAMLATVWRYTSLFWKIASSRMFAYHLQLLGQLSGEGMLLGMPNRYSKNVYQRFAKFGLLEEVERVDGEKAKDGDLDLQAEGAEGEIEGEVEADEDMRDELKTLVEDTPGAPDDAKRCFEVYKRWMRINTSHYSALRVLALGKQQDPRVNISLVAVDQPTIGSDKVDWRPTIRRLSAVPASTNPDSSPYDDEAVINAEAVIDVLQQKIDDRNSINRIWHSFGKTTPKPRKELGDPGYVRLRGSVHCEAALASLAKYANQALQTEDDSSDLGRHYADLRDLFNVGFYLYYHS